MTTAPITTEAIEVDAEALCQSAIDALATLLVDAAEKDTKETQKTR